VSARSVLGREIRKGVCLEGSVDKKCVEKGVLIRSVMRRECR